MPQAQLAPPPIFQFFDANGAPLAGGKLYTYVAGTTTPHATYTDSTQDTENTNPIILDANGECVVWMDETAYKLVLNDANDVLQWTRDNVQFIPDGSITTIKLADGSVTTAKLSDGAVTSAKIADQAVGTDELADDSVTPAKIPDDSIPLTKLTGGQAELQFVETGDPRFGDGPTVFPRKPWSAPAVIPSPSSPAAGDGQCVRWSRTGKLLGVAENDSEVIALFSRFGPNLVRMTNPTATGLTTGDAIAFSPDGEYLAVASGDISATSVFLYQRRGNSWGALAALPITIGHGVTGLSWSPDGRALAASFTQTPFVHVWSLSDIALPWGIRYESTDGQTISTGTHILNYESKVWDNMRAVAAGSGWTFTAYREGPHGINAAAIVNATTAGAGSLKLAVLYTSAQTGLSTTYIIDFRVYISGSTVEFCNGALDALYMYPGDVLSIQFINGLGANGTLDANLFSNWVSIIEGEQYDVLNSFAVISNPATLPAGPGKCVEWSSDGTLLAVGHSSQIYSFTVVSANATLGATYTNNGVTFTVKATISSGAVLTASGGGAPLSSGTLTKTGGTGDATIAFSAETLTAQYLSVFSYSGGTLTRLSDPASLPVGQVNGVTWSPDGTLLTCVHQTTPFITTYQVSGTTLTKIADPAALPAGTGNGAAYSPGGDLLAVAHDASPYITIYSVSGTTLTKLADPGALPTGNGKSVSWTPDTQYLAVGHVNSPFLTAYRTSGVYGSNAVTFVTEVNVD